MVVIFILRSVTNEIFARPGILGFNVARDSVAAATESRATSKNLVTQGIASRHSVASLLTAQRTSMVLCSNSRVQFISNLNFGFRGVKMKCTNSNSERGLPTFEQARFDMNVFAALATLFTVGSPVPVVPKEQPTGTVDRGQAERFARVVYALAFKIKDQSVKEGVTE